VRWALRSPDYEPRRDPLVRKAILQPSPAQIRRNGNLLRDYLLGLDNEEGDDVARS
jgi:hypothetical protein